MTNNTINVPRELLERVLYLMDNYIGTTHPEEDEIRALLSAPSPAGVDGLRVEVGAQAQRIGELDGLLREAKVMLDPFNSGVCEMQQRIDAALSAGHEPKQCT